MNHKTLDIPASVLIGFGLAATLDHMGSAWPIAIAAGVLLLCFPRFMKAMTL